MNKENPEMPDTVVLKKYFGYLPDQKPVDFLQEVRALSDNDKKFLVEGARKELEKQMIGK